MKRVGLAIALVLAGCFNVDERPCTFACGPHGECPDDYTCGPDSYCHLHGQMTQCAYSDLAIPDLASGELSVTDGGPDFTSMPDAGAPNGTPCTGNNMCLSGHCADGVCCNIACTFACNACSTALTGGANGTCLNVVNGSSDPRGVCMATAMSGCGTDGKCFAGSCERWSSSTVCGAASCSGNMLTTASTCSGTGACNAGTTGACPGNLKCNGGGTACLTACSGAGDCASGTCFNPGASGTCGAPLAPGLPCSANNQCASGLCGVSGNGHCCTGTCTTGAPCGASDCTPTTGACNYPTATTSCGSASCAGSTFTPAARCNGSGGCTTGTSGACGGGLNCNSGGTACLMTCGSDNDCASSTTYCPVPGTSTACMAKGSSGAMCTANDQCTSNICGVGGTGTHCCAVACSPTATPCGATDCSATTGACVFPNTSTTCGSSLCSSGMLTPAPLCNGTGTCNAAGAPAPCPGGFVCANTMSCKTACATNSDCVSSSNVCKNPGVSGTCVAGNALAFDATGSGAVAIATAAALNPTTTLTVETWANNTNASGTMGNYIAAVAAGDAPASVSPTGYLLGYNWTTATTVGASFNVVVAGTKLGCIGPALAAGTHHLAGTYNSTTGVLVLYVDGAQACTVTGTAGSAVSYSGTQGVVLGAPATADALVTPFQGKLDDTRISNVIVYASAGFTPARHPTASASTVGLWPMDEGSGTTTADASTTGANGTLSATGVTWTTEP